MKLDFIVLLGGMSYGIFKGAIKGILPTEITRPIDDIVRNDPNAKAGQFIGETIVKFFVPIPF